MTGGTGDGAGGRAEGEVGGGSRGGRGGGDGAGGGSGESGRGDAAGRGGTADSVDGSGIGTDRGGRGSDISSGGGGVGGGGGGPEHRIDDLARHSGTTVRTIRAYQDRGLLPRPARRGRANVYDDSHLTRLRQIAALLERGYTLASIKELLEAWDGGRGLSGVLGLVSEVEGPWTDEEPERLTRAELDTLFGISSEPGPHPVPRPAPGHGPDQGRGHGQDHRRVAGPDQSSDAVAEAVELGVLVPLPERPGEFLVPSPRELAVAAELHRAGVPLLALTEHLRELRAQVEHIASRFMEFTGQHVFGPCMRTAPSDEEATEAAGLVRRLRPLAQQTVEAELGRAMRTFASRRLREHLRGSAEVAAPDTHGAPEAPKTPAAPAPAATTPTAAAPDATAGHVRLPARTLAAVLDLVGADQAAAFVTAATEREVQARAMDRLTEHRPGRSATSEDTPQPP